MNKRPDPSDLSPEEVLADYVDYLCAPLAGVVPFRERQGLRDDALYMIERYYSDNLNCGIDNQQAMRQAIRRYGQSHKVATQLVEVWFRYQPQGNLTQRFGLANVVALTAFGQATFWTILIVLVRVYFPDPHPYHFAGLSPEQIRRLLPEPLPLPETGPTFILFLLVLVAAPFLAGVVVGLRVPVHPARAVCLAHLPLVLLTLFVGLQTLPMIEGLSLSVVQIFYWLPVGSVTAHITALLIRQSRCRHRDE